MFKIAAPSQRIQILRLRHAIVNDRSSVLNLRYLLPVASFIALAAFAISSSDMLLL